MQPKTEYVDIPQKCIVPSTDEPVMDNTEYSTYPEITTKAINNYELMKAFAYTVVENSKVCQ